MIEENENLRLDQSNTMRTQQEIKQQLSEAKTYSQQAEADLRIELVHIATRTKITHYS